MAEFHLRAIASNVLSLARPQGGADETLPEIDRRSAIPLFLQLTGQLREILNCQVSEGKLKPGDFFTTEKAICRRFGVSTITAKRALDDLEAEGLLIRHRGRGTFVAHPCVNQVLDHFYRFATPLQQQGYRTSWKNLDIGTRRPDAKVARVLGLTPNDEVFHLERLRFVNDEPVFLHTSYLPTKLFPGLENEDHDSVALYDLLGRKYNLAPTRCQDAFEPVLLHKRAATLLGVPPRSAGMQVERIAYTAGGLSVEFSHGVIRGDHCRLTVDLR